MTGFKLVQKKPVPDQPQQTPPPKKNETEKPKTSTAKELLNQNGSQYLEDCVICRNDVKVTISQTTPSASRASEKQKETPGPQTEQMTKTEAKEVMNIKQSVKNEFMAESQKEKIPEKIKIKESKNSISTINNHPPKQTKTESENKKLSVYEKTAIENQTIRPQSQNKIGESKTISPINISIAQSSESKTALQNHSVSFQSITSTNSPQILSATPTLLVNPIPQINMIPQIMPTLNTVLLTQLIPQRPTPTGKEVKFFGDFLPTKNNKQTMLEPEKLQFSTPLISTKVLGQILANKDTTSLNTLRAILHLFGREIEHEKDETDLEGSYGLWKEYLKKIKRKKAKQTLNNKGHKKISLPHRIAIEEA
jgi:hypothetical protein